MLERKKEKQVNIACKSYLYSYQDRIIGERRSIEIVRMSEIQNFS